jgi:hypothetical protein
MARSEEEVDIHQGLRQLHLLQQCQVQLEASSSFSSGMTGASRAMDAQSKNIWLIVSQ